MKARGIPDPRPDLDSLVKTTAALKESVESNAQGLRDKSLPSTDVTRARRIAGSFGSRSQNQLDTIINALP